MWNRRQFLSAATKTTAALAASPEVRAWGSTDASVAIRLKGGGVVAQVPPNFVGLGYEMSSAARIGLLSVTNSRYVQMVGNLGAQGVLRLGGIVADYTRYEPQGQVMAEPKNTVVTRASLEQLRDFLQKTGWTAIWSVNFAQGTMAEAVSEARDVSAILGPHLEAIEIGNEVENYGAGKSPFRKQPYTYETYRAEYQAWHEAMARAVPGLRFAAPDTASSIEWVERMAKDAKGEVQLLTTHYYRGGQRQGSAEQLNYPDPMLRSRLERLTAPQRAAAYPGACARRTPFSEAVVQG